MVKGALKPVYPDDLDDQGLDGNRLVVLSYRKLNKESDAQF